MQGHPVNVKHDARYDMAKAGGETKKKTNRRILIYYCCQWRSQGGGTLVHVPPRRHTGKIFKSMDLLLLAMKDRYAFSICLQLLEIQTQCLF